MIPVRLGENVEPFCKKRKNTSCDPVFRHPHNIHENCIPVYYNSQNPQKDCSLSSRCRKFAMRINTNCFFLAKEVAITFTIFGKKEKT